MKTTLAIILASTLAGCAGYDWRPVQYTLANMRPIGTQYTPRYIPPKPQFQIRRARQSTVTNCRRDYYGNNVRCVTE